jgi:hypothetical protein
MLERRLLILKYMGNTPFLATCERCQLKFFTPRELGGKPVEAELAFPMSLKLLPSDISFGFVYLGALIKQPSRTTPNLGVQRLSRLEGLLQLNALQAHSGEANCYTSRAGMRVRDRAERPECFFRTKDL